MSKRDRHNKILALISNFDVETQGQLTDMLIEQGFDVTQATVSRDIKELKLVKTTNYANHYKYTIPSSNTSGTMQARLVGVLQHAVTTIRSAMNMLSVKTIPGSAQGCAMAIETLNFDEVMGVIAGDDTIFIMTPSDKDAHSLVAKLEEVIGQ